MQNDDNLDADLGRVELDRSGYRSDSGQIRARAQDRLRVRTALAISALWGVVFFGLPDRQPPPELSAAFFAAVAYLLGTRTPEE